MAGSPIGYEPYGQGLARYRYDDGSTQLGPLIPDLVNGLKAPQLQTPPVPSPPSPTPRAPGPPPLEIPKAPRGMGISNVTVQPGVDTSEQRAAVNKGGEEVAAAQVNLANAQADSLRAESDQKSAAAFGEANKVARDKEANDLAIKASAEKIDRLTNEKDAPVDPYAYGKELGIGGSFAAILAAGLVGALRAKAGQNTDVNPVVQAIHAKVQESIALQQDERANARADRGTRLAIERERWGDAKQAGVALELRGQQAANRYYEVAAEKNRGTPLGAQGELNAAATRARIGELSAQLKQDEHGKVSVTMARLQGKAPMTLAQQYAEQEAAMKIRQNMVSSATQFYAGKKTPEEIEKLVDETHPELAALGRGRTTEQRAADEKAKTEGKDKATDQQRKAADARKAIETFATKAGLKLLNGSYVPGEGIVPPGTLEGLNPLAETPVNDYLDQAVESYGRFRSGGVIGPTERPGFEKQLGKGTLTRTQLASKLNAARAAIDNQLSEGERVDAEQRSGATALDKYKVKP